MILSVLRCGQFVSDHSSILNWASFKATESVHLDPVSYSCVHSYTIELLSIDPLVIYINNFLSEEEIEYLLDLA